MSAALLQASLAKFATTAGDPRLEYVSGTDANGNRTMVKNEAYQRELDPYAPNWWQRQGGLKGIYNTTAGAVGEVAPSLRPEGIAATLTTWGLNGATNLAQNKDYYLNNVLNGNSGGARHYKYYPAQSAPVAEAPKGFWSGVGHGFKGFYDGAVDAGQRMAAPVYGKEITHSDMGYWSADGERQDHGINSPVKPSWNHKYVPTWNNTGKPADWGRRPAVPPVVGQNKSSGWLDSLQQKAMSGFGAGMTNPLDESMTQDRSRFLRPDENPEAPTRATFTDTLKAFPREFALGRFGILRNTGNLLGLTVGSPAYIAGNFAGPTVLGVAESAGGKNSWRGGLAKYWQGNTGEADFRSWWEKRFGNPDSASLAGVGYETLRAPLGALVNIVNQGKRFLKDW